MKYLFFVGNKRSGTTHLMRLLNFDSRIHISNESDLIWILFSLYNKESITRYPLDSPKAFNRTMKIVGNTLDKLEEPEDQFARLIQMVEPTIFPENLQILGDQKMFQHADPKVVEFIIKNFNQPHFIHIYRHPAKVLRSQLNFQRETGASDYDNIWKGKSLDQLIREWVYHEQRVLDIVDNNNIKLLSIDYEDLVFNPIKTMKRIGNFLSFSFSFEVLFKCYLHTFKKIKSTPPIERTRELEDVMKTLNLRDDIRSSKYLDFTSNILFEIENVTKKAIRKWMFPL
jgi:hypothetical protein